MRGERVEPEGAGQVGDNRGGHPVHGRRDARDGGVGGGQDEEVDARRRARGIVGPAQQTGHVPTGDVQSARQRGAGATRADDAHSRQFVPPVVPAHGRVPVDVLEITRSVPTWPSVEMSASVIPSARYSCAGSPLRFSSGRTATELIPPRGPTTLVRTRTNAVAIMSTAARPTAYSLEDRMLRALIAGNVMGRPGATN